MTFSQLRALLEICLNSYDYTLKKKKKIKEVIDDVYEKRLKPKK